MKINSLADSLPKYDVTPLRPGCKVGTAWTNKKKTDDYIPRQTRVQLVVDTA